MTSQGSSEFSFPSTPTPASLDVVAQWNVTLQSPAAIPNPLELRHNGRTYYRRDRLPQATRGRPVSTVWSRGHWYVSEAENDGLDKPIEAWVCGQCSKFVPMPTSSTSNITRHLAQHDAPRGRSQTPGSSGGTQRAPNLHKGLMHTVDVEKWRCDLLHWIIASHTPFREVESPHFRRMVERLWPPIAPYLVSHQTIREWLRQEYHLACDSVRGWLQRAASRVHISFDVWTAPQGYGMLGIIAHCVDSASLQNQHVLLGLQRMPRGHTGQEISNILLSRLEFWNLSGAKIGVFVADNATANDVAIKLTLEALIPGIQAPEQRRGRCIGHVINLAAKAYLYGEEVDAFEQSVEGVGSSNAGAKRLKIAQQEWRKRGPIGKLHNLVSYIRAGTSRRDFFRTKKVGDAKIDDLELVQDNNTRWNSTYYMIQRALLVQTRLYMFCREWQPAHEIINDILNDEEWNQLAEIVSGLKTFETVTKQLQGQAKEGHFGSVWEVLPCIEYLLQQLEEKIPIGKRGKTWTPIQVASQNAWNKLNKYYNLTDTCHQIYAAGALFNPELRRHYFDQVWTGAGIAEHKEPMLDKVRQAFYADYTDPSLEDVDHPPSKRPKRERSPNPIRRYMEHALHGLVAEQSDNDFDEYIRGPSIPDINNLIAWWYNKSRGLESRLWQQAIDVLSIPAMSTEVERLFSSTSLLVTSRRNRLLDETMEEAELLKQWLDADIVRLSAYLE